MNTFRKVELMMIKQRAFVDMIKHFSSNESLLIRFKQYTIVDDDGLLKDFYVEDTVTGKTYKHITTQELIKDIATDLRKEKIAKILAI